MQIRKGLGYQLSISARISRSSNTWTSVWIRKRIQRNFFQIRNPFHLKDSEFKSFFQIRPHSISNKCKEFLKCLHYLDETSCADLAPTCQQILANNIRTCTTVYVSFGQHEPSNVLANYPFEWKLACKPAIHILELEEFTNGWGLVRKHN